MTTYRGGRVFICAASDASRSMPVSCGGRNGTAAGILFPFRVNFDQPVQELAALEQGLDADVLVEAMNVPKVAADEHGFHTVRRNPDGVRELSIRGARLQDRQHRHSWPELRGELLDRAKHLGCQRRRW